jgi:hypothetical protein
LARVTAAHQGDPFASSMGTWGTPDYDTHGFVIGIQRYARRRTGSRVGHAMEIRLQVGYFRVAFT